MSDRDTRQSFGDWFDKNFAKGFASAIEDIRRTVVETGWFGKPVTGRTSTITIGSLGEQSPSEKLGWDVPGTQERATQHHDRDPAAKERQGPERGIDL